MRDALAGLGFDVPPTPAHLIALPAGHDQRAIAMRDLLTERGVFGTILCPPVTARHRTLVRFALHAELTDVEVQRIVLACEQVRDTFGTVPPVPVAPPRPVDSARHAMHGVE
ncbi:hypothetical protein ACWEKT_14135 [Nocardia takedensis]